MSEMPDDAPEDTPPEEDEAPSEEEEVEETTLASTAEPGPIADLDPPKRGPGRPRKVPAAAVGAASVLNALPPEAKARFTATNALSLADEICNRLRLYPRLGSPENLRVQVWTLERGNEQMLPGSGFDFTAVCPSEGSDKPASQLLYDYLIDTFHITRSTAPAGACLYKVLFQWKHHGRIYASGRVQLPSVEEIRSMRRAAAMRPGSEPQPYGTGYAPTPYAPPRPAAPPPPPAAAPPQPSGNPHFDQMAMMQYQLAQLQGQLSEALAYARERSAAPPYAPPPAPPTTFAAPPPAPAAPAPAPLTMDGVRQMVRETVGQAVGELSRELTTRIGLVPQGPGGSSLNDKMRTNVESLIEKVLDKGFGEVGRAIESAVKQGFGAAPLAEEAAEPEIPEPPPDPRDSLPFELIPTGFKWPDGQDVTYAKDKETGGFHTMGFGFGNPFVTTKAGELAQTVAESLKTFAERMAAPTREHVVGSIPKDARPAGPPPNGRGWQAP